MPSVRGGVRAPARATVLVALALVLTASGAVYAPIIDVFFHEDDLFLLYQLTNDPPATALLRPYLGHANLVRNAVAAVTLGAFGPHAEAFQATVLAGHLVAVALLFGLVLRVTDSALIACLGALAWGTCPTSVGTLGWYAAFGQTLCTILTLLALHVLVTARAAPDGLTGRRIAACALLVGAAAASFGTGIALGLAFPAVVCALAPPHGASRRVAVAAIAIPMAATIAYVGPRLTFAALGGIEDETVIMRGIFHARPLYAAELLVHFLGVGTASLVAGPFLGRIPWPTPGTAILAALASALALLSAWLGTTRDRRVLLTALVLAAATYGAVVVGRSGYMRLIGSLPEAVATGPRYHYAAQAWLTLGLATALSVLQRRLPTVPTRALIAAGIVAIVAGHLSGALGYESHANVRRVVAETLEDIRRAAVEVPAGGVVRIPNRYFPAAPLLAARPDVFPGIAGIFVVFHPSDEIAGRRVVFEAARAHVADAARRGGRIASLLVAPPAGRPDPPFGPPARAR